jgi:Na+-transporting NADH:ubiquinone oxidoreductase subunit NqrB
MEQTMFKDPRDFQILFLSCFLLIGICFRDFSIHFANVVAVIAATLLTQWILAPHSNRSFRSAWITALSLCLLLRANSIFPMAAAGCLSILSKFTLRFRGKHFFNPSNFGIVILLLSGKAWVTPGQWGQDVWFAFFFLAAGAMVLRKVGRLETTGAFLLTYALLEFRRNVMLGWTFDVFAHRMMSGSLLLFSFFMITDPRVIPDRKSARVFWTALVAVLAFILRNYFFLPTAIFWALFALSPFSIVFDALFPAKRFEWVSRESPAAPNLRRMYESV